jgi:2-iminobutanoate/2-iminopropanoate deaminase
MSKRRTFLKSAAGIGSGATLLAAASQSTPGGRTAVPGGIRLGDFYFASGATGVNPERRSNSGASPGAIGEQTTRILERHKKNLEALGSSLENVLKVTVFLADPRNDKAGMNAAYAKFFPKDAPARSAVGVQFPDDVTKVEIELIAWIPPE